MNILIILIYGWLITTADSAYMDKGFDKLLQKLQHTFTGKTNMTGAQNYGKLLDDLKSLQLMTEGNLGKLVRSFNTNITGQNNPQPGNAAVKPTVSETCMLQISQLWTSLTAREMWALSMVDAAGKPPSGLLDGNFFWMGSFDQCKRLKDVKIKGHPEIPSFNGQSCDIDIPLQKLLESFLGNYPVSLHERICVPDSCSQTDVLILVNTLLKNIPFGLHANKAICAKNHLDLDTRAIAGIAVCGFFVFLMLCGTLYDLHLQFNEKPQKERGLPGKLLLSFSVYTNSKKIMSTEQAGGALGAVNGIRFLSMSWVILGHTYVFVQQVNENPAPFMTDTFNHWTNLAVTNALVSVDSFFALSGLLLAYLFLREMKKNGGATKTNWFMFYFHRFWRLSPPYWLLMFVDMSLLKYWGNGPMWDQTGIEGEQCNKNWWTNIIYLNNFIHSDKMCFAWSWYLANDMQFFVLSPLMLVPLYYSKKAGTVMCVLFLLANSVAAGVISTVEDLPASLFGKNLIPSAKYFPDYYIKPYCRIGPYVVGMFTGYLLYRWNGKCKINKFVNIALWGLTIGCVWAVIYGLNDVVQGGSMSTEVAALYNSLHRSVWGACVCWIIFSCVTGHGGFVNKILAWKGFIPLGRLSYCAYLVHPLIMVIYLGGLRSPPYLNTTNMIFMFLGHMMASYAAAFIASLAFEAPMMGLEKAIFRRGGKK